MKVRTTVMLDEVVLRKLQFETDNMSAYINDLLNRALFGRRKSMLGVFKGEVSGADKIKEDE